MPARKCTCDETRPDRDLNPSSPLGPLTLHCSEHTEEKRPINLQYRGAVDSEGYQQYYGRVTDACSTFYDGRPEPERWRVYFTPKPDSKGNGGPGYISPRFY